MEWPGGDHRNGRHYCRYAWRDALASGDWPRWKESFDRIQSPRDWSLTRCEWTVLVGGYLLLAVACYREAVAITQAAG